MRIAMLHWGFPPVIGGVETHLAMLCPELVRRGNTVSLLVGSVDGRHERGIWSGVYVARTPLMDLNYLRQMDLKLAEQAVRREIHQFLSEVRPDLVHAHNLHYFSPTHRDAVADWCQRSGVPLVLTAHNVWEDALWEAMCRRADVWDITISVSRYVAKEMRRSGFPAERLVVIHHGLDSERFQPVSSVGRRMARQRYPRLGGKRVILHPARASIAKGSLVAVEALGIIHRSAPEVLLVLAGAGPIVDWGGEQGAELAEIRSAIRRLGLEESVILRSFAWQEMTQLYHAADVVVYPSIFEEPFGLAPLEAMACGVPVVVSRAGGMPEFVEHGRTGLVVPKGDPVALAEACLELLQSPRRRSVFGQQARRAVLERHTVAAMCDQTGRIYETALVRGRTA